MRRILVTTLAFALVLSFGASASASVAPSSTGMLREQVASQEMINALLGNTKSSLHVSSITFGKVAKTTSKATIPITVRTKGGSIVRGVLVMYRFEKRWYFHSITRGTKPRGISTVKIPAGITTSVVKNAIVEQREHQWMLQGIVNGGYKKLTVTGRGSNWNTRRVSVRLSGGTRDATTGRVYAYSKTATNGKRYWFISSLK